MTDDFCICGDCGNEVESIFRYSYIKGEYEHISGLSWCMKCREVKEKNKTFWRHYEY